MKQRYIIFLLPVFFLSCTNISNQLSGTGWVGITILFAVLLASMIGMLYYVSRKRKQAENTAVNFSHSVKMMVDKLEGVDKKIAALEHTIYRIESDEKYKKDTAWRDKLLSKVYQEIAAVYYKDKQPDKVIESCSKVIELEPGHMMSHYNRGTLYGNLGMYSKAIKDLTSAADIDSSYANIYNNRGLIYDKMGELDAAIIDYGYASAIEPSPVVYYNRGNAYAKMGENEKAMDDYRSALALADHQSEIRKQVEAAIKLVE